MVPFFILFEHYTKLKFKLINEKYDRIKAEKLQAITDKHYREAIDRNKEYLERMTENNEAHSEFIQKIMAAYEELHNFLTSKEKLRFAHPSELEPKDDVDKPN